MRQVGIKQLKANLSRELQDLPFEVTTRKGKLVTTLAVVDYPVKLVSVTTSGPVTTRSVTTSTAGDYQCIDAAEFLQSYPGKPASRYNDIPLNLSKEAQAKGHMGH